MVFGQTFLSLERGASDDIGNISDVYSFKGLVLRFFLNHIHKALR